MLDNSLPAGGFLKVDLPATLAHTPTSCSHWAVAAGSLGEAPTTATGTISGSTSTFYCLFETALSANTAYGLALAGEANAESGVYAPVGLSTRMNSVTTNIGPVFDTNQVFDSVAVSAVSVALAVELTKTLVADEAKEFPSESYSTTIKFDFSALPNEKISVPYNLIMTLDHSENRE
jgi:hypothetical protein